MMCYYQRRKRPTQVSSELPFEIISEILSWLPVLSLLKFKCVCKQWFLLLQDYRFIAKHSNRTCCILSPYYHCEWENKSIVTVSDKKFELKGYCSGLSLEKSTTSQVCRIRNPATRKVLYLPDAHDEGSKELMDLGLNSLTGECKVFRVYFDTAQEQVGIEVITVGKDEMWRPLHKQNKNWLGRGKPVLKQSRCGADKVEWALHLPEIITEGRKLCLQIHSLDLWSERLTTTTLPQGAFIDLENLWPFLWDNRPAVAGIVGGDLHILVLVDFKEHKWSQNKIIFPLKNLEVDDTILTDKIALIQGRSNQLVFLNGEQLISYDIEKKTVKVFANLESLKERIPRLNKRVVRPEASELPFEIIVEILSWLPVESLVRFKCVCKLWCLLIGQDYEFIAKHESLACYERLPTDYNFNIESRYAGLFQEKSGSSQVCQIRNPATRQVLYLPDAHEGVVQMDIIFNSLTHECKVTGGGTTFFTSDKDGGIVHLPEILTDGHDLYLEVHSLDLYENKTLQLM
ncbi:hypothetical protein ACFX1Z_005262 [Malus domestica]